MLNRVQHDSFSFFRLFTSSSNLEKGNDDTTFLTASIDDLILMKQGVARDKDLSDIAALKWIKILKEKEK